MKFQKVDLMVRGMMAVEGKEGMAWHGMAQGWKWGRSVAQASYKILWKTVLQYIDGHSDVTKWAPPTVEKPKAPLSVNRFCQME